MKRNYKIDAAFYFALVLVTYYRLTDDELRPDYEKGFSKALNHLNKELNQSNINALGRDRLMNLVPCVGSVLFDKKQKFYFAKIEEIYQLLYAYTKIIDTTFMEGRFIEHSLRYNLNGSGHQKSLKLFDEFLKDDDFRETRLPSEMRKLSFYLKNKSKKSEGKRQ